MRSMVIGVGNEDRGDDAAGRWVARRLKVLVGDGVRVVESTGECTALMALWQEADNVILIDAVVTSSPAGSLHRWDLHQTSLPTECVHGSTHALGVAEAIELARTLELLPPRIIFYGITGTCFEPKQGVTPTVACAIEQLVTALGDMLCGTSPPLSPNQEEPPMHEQSLMNDLMEKILTVSKAHNAQKVLRVDVWLGALSHLSPDHFTEHYATAAQGTIAEDAHLNILTSDDINDPNAQQVMLKNVQVVERCA